MPRVAAASNDWSTPRPNHVTDTLRERVQQALGTSHTIERELGGGGMSRVFVATEHAFCRQVVVKVLPSDAAAQLSLDRFAREIQVAARLQHPHIVPLLSAGDAGGVPYFTMPFVEGESLRVRLDQRGELPSRARNAMSREAACRPSAIGAGACARARRCRRAEWWHCTDNQRRFIAKRAVSSSVGENTPNARDNGDRADGGGGGRRRLAIPGCGFKRRRRVGKQRVGE